MKLGSAEQHPTATLDSCTVQLHRPHRPHRLHRLHRLHRSTAAGAFAKNCQASDGGIMEFGAFQHRQVLRWRRKLHCAGGSRSGLPRTSFPMVLSLSQFSRQHARNFHVKVENQQPRETCSAIERPCFAMFTAHVLCRLTFVDASRRPRHVPMACCKRRRGISGRGANRLHMHGAEHGHWWHFRSWSSWLQQLQLWWLRGSVGGGMRRQWSHPLLAVRRRWNDHLCLLWGCKCWWNWVTKDYHWKAGYRRGVVWTHLLELRLSIGPGFAKIQFKC